MKQLHFGREPIYFSGVNCYCNCAINIAAFEGAEYQKAFGRLWSETDFEYNSLHGVYVSKRLYKSLEIMGISFEALDCGSAAEAEEGMSRIEIGDFAIIGMDSFDIPWNPFYQMLHCLHYFIGFREKEGRIYCIDPMNNLESIYMREDEITAYAFDLKLLHRSKGKQPNEKSAEDAQELIDSSAHIKKKFIDEIRCCKGENHKNAKKLAMYADALTGNRYLYKSYIQSIQPNAAGLFDKSFFSSRQAVKNGLLKASMTENNGKIIEELCTRITSLLDQETAMACRAIDNE